MLARTISHCFQVCHYLSDVMVSGMPIAKEKAVSIFAILLMHLFFKSNQVFLHCFGSEPIARKNKTINAFNTRVCMVPENQFGTVFWHFVVAASAQCYALFDALIVNVRYKPVNFEACIVFFYMLVVSYFAFDAFVFVMFADRFLAFSIIRSIPTPLFYKYFMLIGFMAFFVF